MNEPILEIRDLCKSHTGKPPYFFARIDSLRLWPGQALGITGASGCGKSTLLEMLALLTRPDRAGRFILRTDGAVCDLGALWCHDTRRLASIRREHMGFVHQAGGLYPFLTAEENIRLPLLLNGMDADEAILSRVQELLDFLNLRHVADSLPENLSYGERQRTAIARALVHRPRLILADEPTSALDPDSARNAMRLLRDGALRYGGGLLVVSHDHALLDAAGIPPLAMRPEVDADGDSRRYVLTQPTESRPIIDASPSRAHDSPSSAPPGFAARARLACYLAWRDFRHEYALSFCAVLAFAAALAPIMVLGGLRNGVIATLTQRLLNNPAALSVNPYGSSRYTEKDLAELAALPSVTFLVPLTRTLASTVRIPRPNRPPVTVDVIPTVEGDPLLLRYASVPPEGAAVITQDLARSLPQAAVGQPLDLVVSRRFQGREQQVVCTVRIHAILPDAADWKAHIYLPLPLLLDMERYRDGLAVPARDWPGNARQEDEERVYAGFRMYVDGLDAVIPMRDELKRRGIDAYTFAREVETIQSLRNALTLITLLVGCVTLVGMGFSLASLAVANVRRKARFFAQGRLMGLEKGQLLSLPLIQLALTAVLAATCSMLLYACVAVLLDMAASPWLEQGESACRLAGAHIALLYAGSFLLACLCGAAACRNLLSLQPAEVLRRDA